MLAIEPVNIPSGRYDESLKVERTQPDLIAEMGLELSRLPPRTACIHVLQQRDGIQVVRQAKIQTLTIPAPYGQSLVDAIIERSHTAACKPSEAIETEIRERQESEKNAC